MLAKARTRSRPEPTPTFVQGFAQAVLRGDLERFEAAAEPVDEDFRLVFLVQAKEGAQGAGLTGVGRACPCAFPCRHVADVALGMKRCRGEDVVRVGSVVVVA